MTAEKLNQYARNVAQMGLEREFEHSLHPVVPNPVQIVGGKAATVVEIAGLGFSPDSIVALDRVSVLCSGQFIVQPYCEELAYIVGY